MKFDPRGLGIVPIPRLLGSNVSKSRKRVSVYRDPCVFGYLNKIVGRHVTQFGTNVGMFIFMLNICLLEKNTEKGKRLNFFRSLLSTEHFEEKSIR